MGRRKSKISKQKQAKAAAATFKSKTKLSSSSFGGVTVHKGGGGGNGRRDRINNAAIGGGSGVGAGSSSNDSKHKIQKSVTRRWTSSSSSSSNGGKKLSMLDQALKGNGGVATTFTDEQNDFDKEFASLQERSLRRQQTSSTASRKIKRRKNNKFKNASVPNMTPGILNMGPKSTEEMVEEATHFVASGMNDIGATVQPMNPMNNTVATNDNNVTATPMASNLLQVLATKKRSEWSAMEVQKQKEEEEFQQGKDPNNPFGALGGWQDDTDDEEEAKQRKEKKEQLQFAPASFSFGDGATGAGFDKNSVPPAHGIASMGDFEDDPDL